MIDFGIARAAEATTTRSGLRLGTPSWMAPEQLRDRPAGPPSDVFAWGVLVAFAATGRHPFGGGPPEAVAYRILHHPPDLTGVPEPVRHLVADALARDPAARPTAALLASTLAAALPPTLPLPAADPTLVLPVAAGPTRRRRRRVGRLLAAVALLAGLVAAPQVVLAAAGGPDGPASRPAAKHCPGDREDVDTREARDHEPDDEVEAEEEDEEEAAGTMAAAPDGPGDGDDAAPSPGGARGPGERPAGAGRDGPPPTGHAPRDPGPGPGQVVLGS